MKKLFSFVVLIALVLSLATCGGETGQGNGTDSAASGDHSLGTDSGTEQALSGFALGHSLYTKVIADMKAAVGDSIEANNEALEIADPDNYINNSAYLNVHYSPFSSYRLLLIADLGREKGIETVERAYALYGYKDISVSKTEKGYSLSYKLEKDGKAQSCTEEIFCKDNGSFTMLCHTDGAEAYFIDFCVIGEGEYALQNQTDRAIVKYENSTIVSVLHSETVNDYDYSSGKYHDYSLFYSYADSVQGRTDISAGWVTEAESQGKIRLLFDYTAERLSVTGQKAIFNWETDSYDYVPMPPVTIAVNQ